MKFLNIHILHPLPFSNLNRDDSGSPKSVVYGGTNRARVSSQALKRAARVAFEAGSDADRTQRSKYNATLVRDMALTILTDSGVELDDTQTKALDKAATRAVSSLVKKDDKVKDGDEGKTDTLTWLAEGELRETAAKVAEKFADGVDIAEAVSSETSSLTIAAFGRMFAERPDLQTEAAIQVAHAFTTHTASTEVDYFTAVDDLRADITGDQGAGHLDLAEFTNGVFYRYLNIDRDQLLANWSDSDHPEADERFKALLSSLVLSLPSGKTNTTAPHTLPALIILEESSVPLSFASAFEAPVHPDKDGGGYITPSAQTLLDFADKARRTAGSLFGHRVVVALVSNLAEQATLDEMLSFGVRWLEEG